MTSETLGPPVSKTTYVLNRLREEISTGVITPGEPLPQAELAERYGVSPTPVREALRLLEADGMVSYSPHRGATVAELDLKLIRDLYLLRATVERLATKLAVERMSEADAQRVERVHRELSGSVDEGADHERLSRLNRELHFAIYDSGSPMVAGQVKSLWRPFSPASTLWDDETRVKILVSQHDAIVRAVVARDAELASGLMFEHVMTAGRLREDVRVAEDVGA